MPPLIALVAALLAIDSNPAKVALELEVAPRSTISDAEQARLRNWLVERLAEEGFSVTSAAASTDPSGQLRLHVLLADTHWQVTANGAAQHSETVASGAFEVVALELLHKAASALERARAQPATANAPTTTAASTAQPSTPTAQPSTPAARKATAASAIIQPAQVAERRQLAAPESHSAPFAAWRWGLEGSAGWQQRGDAGDPLLDLRLATVNPYGLGARVQLGLTWSSLPPALDIWEFAALVGPTWSAPLSRRWAFVTGVLGGVRTHVYTFEQNTNFVSTWLALAPVEARFKFGTKHIGGGMFAGIAGAPPKHELWGITAWERSALLWGAVLSAGVEL